MTQKHPSKNWGLLVLLALALAVLTGCSNFFAAPTPTPIPTLTPTLAPTLTPTTMPGQVRVDAQGIEQVWVPAGSFLMGSDDATIQELKDHNLLLGDFANEQPQHEVHLTQGYWIDKYEVTN